MASAIAILNAEQYLGTSGIPHLHGKAAGRVKKTTSQHSHADGGPRKRAKTSSTAVVTEVAEVDEDGEGETTKRARGRPRLDTKDQSAADRRRTQIRLAQRAYRSRKENAIQTLEKKVQDLQCTNEEMNDAFMKLHDFAVSYGILDISPDFARELHATTEKFLLLAKKMSDAGEDYEQAGSEHESGLSEKSPKDRNSKSNSPEASEPVQATQTNPESTIWGYSMMTDPEMAHAFTMTDLPATTIPPPTTTTHTPPAYEVISMPTLDNASFPFSFDTDPTLQEFFNNTTGQISPTVPSPSPFSSLPLPNSLSYNEITFGRRLQRSSVQRGYHLITMANPPKDDFAKVFGFCLLFETVDKIRQRLRRGLDRTKAETLNNWQAPFWALGGAGQHLPPSEDGASPVGNQGTADVLKHNFNSNFGLGPFDAKTTEAGRRVDPRMRIMLPGFHGDFYDPQEVEQYLRYRGVVIQPGQDFVTAEIDVTMFEDEDSDRQEELARKSYMGSLSPATSSLGGDWNTQGLDERFGATSTASLSPLDDFGSNMFDTTSSSSGPEFGGESGLLGFSGIGVTSGNGTGNKRLVTLDIDVLIKELVGRGMCLGRSPGFRLKDIHAAFWRAVRTDTMMDF